MLAGIPLMDLAILAVALLAAGAVTGVLAGLFGVGGGAVIVPILYEVFGILGISDDVRMPLAVGTSLAIIIPTSIRSFIGHRRKGAVDMDLLRAWAVPVVLGVLIGSVIARYADPVVFKLVFVIVAGTNAVKLLFGNEKWRVALDLPKGVLLRGYGLLIGLLSALMGIGGGQISNIIMTLHNRGIHQAVATSAGLGVLISVPGAIGYIAAGWGRAGLPPDALGFVSFLGFILIVPTTILTAQLGVNLAHAWSKRKLEIAFGIFLAIVCTRFIIDMF
ncbi:MAG: sulfite exporter TauE/SafE family protein [Salinarimonadaceae bacterium]|nr:MAG: sulfite exporter TauE/SafE family protein [Salinarimonadaceae bacterium]